MPYYCTVPRCTSMAGKAKNVSFHQFPRDEELAKLWNRILKRGKPYTKYSKVCSLHFKPEDYTITSVGKNKGQWRTLRKDAIPSQNLPSESPVPYTRRSSGCWVPGQPSLTDPLVQQQMAQAIYMQTMLAMQAAGVPESLAGGETPTPESTKPSPSSSSLSEIELLLRRDTDQPKEVTFKCNECTKCFKDPDVFLLHKRTHKNTTNVEKENYSANIQDGEDTLRANPILANLLKTSMRLEPENSMNNILTVENQIMAALASNMEAYIRTLSSMISNQANPMETDKGDESDYDENDDRNKADDMCVDDNTPDDDDVTGVQDEKIRNDFEVTVSVNRIDSSAETIHSHESIDEVKEVTNECDDTEINDDNSNSKDESININDNPRVKTQESGTEEIVDSSKLDETQNEATEQDSDNKIRNNATGLIGENNDTLDENINDDSTKDELNDDKHDVEINKDECQADRDESVDEMTTDESPLAGDEMDANGKLGVSCDSFIETVDLIRVDIEPET